MDSALILITVVSSIVALIIAAVAWRIVREDRRRANARVLALRVAAGELEAIRAPISVVRSAPSIAMRPSRAALADDLRLYDAAAIDYVRIAEGTPPVRTIDRAPREHVARAIVEVPSVPAAHSELFASVERRPNRFKPVLIAAAMLAVVAAAYVTSGGFGATATVAATRTEAAPLELLSMRHTRQRDTITITGLVRNPAGSVALEHVAAVAFLFDKSGAFVSSSRAPLDFQRLGGGDESAFAITTSTSAPIGRYRISFRHTDGDIIRHVDRRQAAP